MKSAPFFFIFNFKLIQMQKLIRFGVYPVLLISIWFIVYRLTQLPRNETGKRLFLLLTLCTIFSIFIIDLYKSVISKNKKTK